MTSVFNFQNKKERNYYPPEVQNILAQYPGRTTVDEQILIPDNNKKLFTHEDILAIYGKFQEIAEESNSISSDQFSKLLSSLNVASTAVSF